MYVGIHLSDPVSFNSNHRVTGDPAIIDLIIPLSPWGGCADFARVEPISLTSIIPIRLFVFVQLPTILNKIVVVIRNLCNDSKFLSLFSQMISRT